MLRNRLIATLLVRNGRVIQSRQFNHTNVIGNAFTAVDFFNSWEIDEIIILDITRTRDFHKKFIEEIVEGFTHRIFIPLTVGGWIRSVEDMREAFNNGADKIVINTGACVDNSLIVDGADRFGSQAITVSIDYKVNENGKKEVMVNGNTIETNVCPVNWAKYVEKMGAGEIYLTSIDHDGMMEGYDIETLKEVVEAVNIPVIASGGVGHWSHLVDALNVGVDAVSVANKFHYTEHSTKRAKDYLIKKGMNVRKTQFMNLGGGRKMKYEINYKV